MYLLIKSPNYTKFPRYGPSPGAQETQRPNSKDRPTTFPPRNGFPIELTL